MTVAVSPSSPVLPVMAATSYEVIGQLDYSTVAHDDTISNKKGADDTDTVVKTEAKEHLDNKEIYHCLISRHCQEGDIEDAIKVLQMMLNQKIKISEEIYKPVISSAILRNKETRDIVRRHSVIKDIFKKQWDLFHTFLTCVYAGCGDWEGVKKVMSECHSQGVVLADDEYKEMIFVMSIVGNTEDIAKLLSLTSVERDSLFNILSSSVNCGLLASSSVDKHSLCNLLVDYGLLDKERLGDLGIPSVNYSLLSPRVDMDSIGNPLMDRTLLASPSVDKESLSNLGSPIVDRTLLASPRVDKDSLASPIVDRTLLASDINSPRVDCSLLLSSSMDKESLGDIDSPRVDKEGLGSLVSSSVDKESLSDIDSPSVDKEGLVSLVSPSVNKVSLGNLLSPSVDKDNHSVYHSLLCSPCADKDSLGSETESDIEDKSDRIYVFDVNLKRQTEEIKKSIEEIQVDLTFLFHHFYFNFTGANYSF